MRPHFGAVCGTVTSSRTWSVAWRKHWSVFAFRPIPGFSGNSREHCCDGIIRRSQSAADFSKTRSSVWCGRRRKQRWFKRARLMSTASSGPLCFRETR